MLSTQAETMRDFNKISDLASPSTFKLGVRRWSYRHIDRSLWLCRYEETENCNANRRFSAGTFPPLASKYLERFNLILSTKADEDGGRANRRVWQKDDDDDDDGSENH